MIGSGDFTQELLARLSLVTELGHLRPPACDTISRDVRRTRTTSVESVVATTVIPLLWRADLHTIFGTGFEYTILPAETLSLPAPKNKSVTQELEIVVHLRSYNQSCTDSI